MTQNDININNVMQTVWANHSQEGYYNSNNLLVDGVPPHIQRPQPGGPNLLTEHKYSGASGRGCPFFPVVQFNGLQYLTDPV